MYRLGGSLITFIRTKGQGTSKVNVKHQFISLPRLNFKLRHDQRYITEFNQKSAEKLLNTFQLVGVQQGQEANNVDSEYGIDHAQTFHIQKRAKTPNIWAAIETRKQTRGTVREGDVLYLIAMRFQMNDNFELNPPGASAKELRWIWQFVPYVSSDRQKPSRHLYNESALRDSIGKVITEEVELSDTKGGTYKKSMIKRDGWTGGIVLIGYCWSTYQETVANQMITRHRANNCVFNTNDGGAYKTDIYLLNNLEIFIGLA